MTRIEDDPYGGTFGTDSLQPRAQLVVDDSAVMALSGSPANAYEIARMLEMSFQYYRRMQLQEMSLDGNVVYVTGEGPNETAPFVVQDLQALEGDVFHYLGPRVELETVAARTGPFDIAVFAEFGAFFTVGDDSTSFVIRDATDSARFDFEVDNWLIQAGVGIRLTWRGE